MLAAASNLVVLLRFLDNRGIDLEQRFLTKNFFKPYELDDLRILLSASRKEAVSCFFYILVGRCE